MAQYERGVSVAAAGLGFLCILAGGKPAPSLAQEPGSQGWVSAWATATQDPMRAGFAVGNPAPASHNGRRCS